MEPSINTIEKTNKFVKPLSVVGVLVLVAGIVGLTNVPKKVVDTEDTSTLSNTDNTQPAQNVSDAGLNPGGLLESEDENEFENEGDDDDNVNTTPIASQPVATTPATTSSTTVSSSKYKDGTYSTNGKYSSPAGFEEIGVKVTVKGDIVTDAVVTPMANNSASLSFQKIVANNIKSFVVGKNIDQINLTKVSGSSLTPKGFNDALVKIKVQAKS